MAVCRFYKGLPSKFQLALLLLVFEKKRISFKDQQIYGRERSFIQAAEQLCGAKCLRAVRSNEYHEEYMLTVRGAMVVEDFLRPFAKAA